MKQNIITVLSIVLLSLMSSFSVSGGEKKLVAVHNFNLSPSLRKMKISGWWVGEIMENKLTQTGRCRVVTRARIARVLKEKNISSSSVLEPQKFGKIIGAQYIVTGQVEFAGNKLIASANMINVARRTGEIAKSYEVCGVTSPAQLSVKLTAMIGELAKMLTMTPGEFLDRGLTLMHRGDFQGAVEAFTYFRREANLPQIISLIAMVDQKNLRREAAAVDLSQKSAGEALDYGIELMRQGKLDRAALVFYRLQQSRMARKIKNLLAVAKNGAKKQSEKLNQAISDAKQKFKQAIMAQKRQQQNSSPAELCDAAVNRLQAVLNDPKNFITSPQRSQIEQLITRIEKFRKQLFQGPILNCAWTIPRLKITLLPIKPGKFTIPNPLPVEEQEVPAYTVRISRPFWISRTEITAGNFIQYLKSLHFHSRTERYEIEREINFSSKYCPINKNYRLKRGFNRQQPMTEISWRGAAKFCQWLNESEMQAGRLPDGYEYRLPTEAEWEYCCRAGTAAAFSFGDNTGQLERYAWYRSNSDYHSHKVAQKLPNKWGIYDMHGNVWEWCNDWYSEHFLVADCEDPLGPDASPDNCKVLRGGSFTSSPLDLRCQTRYMYDYKRGKKNIGFRVVCAPQL